MRGGGGGTFVITLVRLLFVFFLNMVPEQGTSWKQGRYEGRIMERRTKCRKDNIYGGTVVMVVTFQVVVSSKLVHMR
jgi:hypothetical protein